MRYFVPTLSFEWGRAVASGEPVGALAPAALNPSGAATPGNWGALASGVVTSRDQYLRYRYVDWQGRPSSARLHAAGGVLATAIGRTDNVFTAGGVFVARRVIRRFFRYEGENLVAGSVGAYKAAYDAIGPDDLGSGNLYRRLFAFWEDRGAGPNVRMLEEIQSWALAANGLVLPDPF